MFKQTGNFSIAAGLDICRVFYYIDITSLIWSKALTPCYAAVFIKTMKRSILYFILIFISEFLLSAAEKDSFAGFYEGTITGCKNYPLNGAPEVFAEVSRGTDSYKVKLLSSIMARSEAHFVVDNLKAENGAIKLDKAGSYKLTGSITPDLIEAEGFEGKNPVKLSLKRKTVVSPTLGLQPPEGAIVLFNGKDFSKWRASDGSDLPWEIKDGAMLAKPVVKDGKKIYSDAITKSAFGPVKIHIEFKIPAEYHIGGYRGNSGVYFGPYEIQVLDSFGSEGNWMECGSIYRIHPPKVNACLEPEAWQTYDIEFTPAKWMGERMVDYPRMTVYQNGVRIHDNEPVYYDTRLTPKRGENYKHPKGNMPISLQYHGNPVEYRNIWLINK